jgi:hypothetical protein
LWCSAATEPSPAQYSNNIAHNSSQQQTLLHDQSFTSLVHQDCAALTSKLSPLRCASLASGLLLAGDVALLFLPHHGCSRPKSPAKVASVVVYIHNEHRRSKQVASAAAAAAVAAVIACWSMLWAMPCSCPCPCGSQAPLHPVAAVNERCQNIITLMTVPFAFLHMQGRSSP